MTPQKVTNKNYQMSELLHDFYSKNEDRLKLLHQKLCGEELIKIGDKYYTKEKNRWLLKPITEEVMPFVQQVIVYQAKSPCV